MFWPRYDEALRATLLIDATDTIVNDPNSAQRTAWGERVLGFK
jgi:para-nitrobenzyl esterase